MSQRIDPRCFNSLIDAHVLDHLGNREDDVVARILELNREEKILLMLPHSVKAEIEHPDTPAEVQKRAKDLIYTEPVSLTQSEQGRLREMCDLVGGNAKPGKHDRDAYHIFEAEKYGGYFITRDQRLIKKRSEIADRLGKGFNIVTPKEFLRIYERS